MKGLLSRTLKILMVCLMVMACFHLSPTVFAEGENETGYILYHYALIPGQSVDGGNPNSRWFGIGETKIYGVDDPANLQLGTTVSEFTLGEEVKKLYPDITYNGKPFLYAPKGSANADKEGYYTLEPFRVIVSDGANAGNNGYNDTVGNGHNTYHYDFTCVLNEKDIYTVVYQVLESDGAAFVTLNDYSQRVSAGTDKSSLRRPSPTLGNCEFDGWYKDSEFTQKADFTGTVNGNTRYYGRFVNAVSYAYNNTVEGAPEPPASSKYVPGATVTVANKPSMTGYTLKGWTAPSTVSVSNGSFTMPATNVSLTGEWVKNSHNVIYKITGDHLVNDSFKTENKVYGETLTLVSDDMTVDGYSWNGWSKLPATMPDEDVEVTGSYSINKYDYTVNYVDTEGKKLIDPLTEKAEFGSVIKGEDKKETIEGYTFESADPESVTISSDPDKNVLNIVYTKNSYVVEFVMEDDKGGETLINVNDTDYSYGDTLRVPADPKKPATNKVKYEFIGWINCEDPESEMESPVTHNAKYVAEFVATVLPDPEKKPADDQGHRTPSVNIDWHKSVVNTSVK